MPEKPEVQHTADCLKEILCGTTLSKLKFNGQSRQAKHELNNYDELCERLPLPIRKVWSKGKKIIIRLAGDVYIMSSLSMEGKWLKKKGDHSHLWLQLEDGRKIYYDDSRHFGNIDIYLSRDELDTKLNKIGPDLLLDDVDIDLWLSIVRNKRLRHMKIGDFVMEQKYFSGVGNYIRAEALYRAEVNPHGTLEAMSDDDHDRVRTAVIDVINESYQARRCTLKTYWDLEGEDGKFKVVIYGEPRDPHGNKVKKELFKKKRMMHWVPTVQIYPPPLEPVKFSVKKLKRSTGRSGVQGEEQYSLIELRGIAHSRGLKVGGNKSVLVERILEDSLYDI
jgi:DNA-formamidopyrimidine glycosylase